MKRKALLLISLGLILVMVFSSVGFAFTSIPVKSINLNRVSLSVGVGKTATLSVMLSPANATNKMVNWFSNDTKIAKVNAKGVVTGVKVGKTTVIVKSADGKASAKCAVSVVKAGLLFDKPTTITMMTMSHPSYPYDPKWFVWGAIKKATNVTLDVQAYGLTEYSDKVTLTMASGKLPDIMYLGVADIRKYQLDGPFSEVTGNLDKTPYFNTWLQSGEMATDTIKTYKASDGKVYVYPIVGAEELLNVRGWMIRKDIFAKNGLTAPKTYDEMYTDLKQLKKAYPSSYPLGMRDFFLGNRHFELITTQWSTGIDAYYDFDKQEWRYGPIENNFKALVEYFRKLYKEGLVPPDLLTIRTKGWTDLISGNQSFVTIDFLVRIDFFNNPMRLQNPEVNLDYIAPPVGSVPNGKAMILKTNYAGGGNCVCNTSNKDNALKFIDWMYSDQGKDLLNWGSEDMTYKVVDGKRQYITNANKDNATQMYGLLSFGVNICGDLQAQSAGISKQCYDAHITAAQSSEKYFNPKWWIDFTKQEQDVKLSLEETIRNRMEQYVSKFITGEIGMDQWDSYVNSIKQLGLDKYMAIHKSSFDRVK